MSTAQSVAKSVQHSPKETAVAIVTKYDVDEKTAMDLVKFMRNPNMVSGSRKREYQRARDHFSKADDVGVEWAFRYAAHKATEPGPFARRDRGGSDVDKLAGSSETDIEKSEGGVWTDSPFTV